MAAKDRMLGYIPLYYHTSQLTNALLDADGNEIDLLNLSIQDVLDQFFIETATFGLKLWEEEYALPINESLDYETRRKRILAKKRKGRGKLIQELKALEPTITIAWGGLILPFTFVSDDDIYDFGPLIDLLERRKPAHLGYDFSVISYGNYTAYANHKNRNKINFELRSGTAKSGRWPWWSSPGQTQKKMVGVKAASKTGSSFFDATAHLYSGPLRDKSNTGVVTRGGLDISFNIRTGANTYVRCGDRWHRLFVHELYTGTIPDVSTTGSISAKNAEIAKLRNVGVKQFDYAGELPVPSTHGALATLNQDIEPGPGSGFGYTGRTGAIYCGEEV